MHSRTAKSLAVMLMLLLTVGYLVSCGGSGQPDPDPTPNPNFDRMTAKVSGGDGAALEGLVVRVEGQPTGITTGADGTFVLTEGSFPKGVDEPNEISLGLNGIVVGSTTVVPVDNQAIDIKLEAENPSGIGNLSGNIFDEVSGNPLDNVELTLFSPEGGVLMQHSNSGSYSFSGVAAGPWQLLANRVGYHPEMAVVLVSENETTIQHLALTPEGSVTPGTGVKVKGTLVDSKTGAPVSGATVSIYADSGYIGIPMPGVIDDVVNPDGSVTSPPNSGGGATEPGTAPGWDGGDDDVDVDSGPGMDPNGGRESSMAPIWHDPQYQETTTASDGTFEFPNEVIGYSLWINYNADGYLGGNSYEDINNKTGVLNLELEIAPIIETSISGTVVDGEGNPVKGAYVEFIFSGGQGGPMPVDIMLPGNMDLGAVAERGEEIFDDFGGPVPPSMPGSDGGDWDDFDEGAPAMGGDNSSGEAASNSGVDNQMMMRFRWENQNGRGTSDSAEFTGYYSAITGDDGSYSFPSVAAGNYSVFASAYRHVAVSFEREILEDSESNVVPITLEEVPVGSVEGTVTDENGQVIPEVLVNAIQPNVDPFSYTDANGHYRIDNIPVGEWLVSGYKQGYLTSNQTVQITEDGVIQVNLVITNYTPPATELIPFHGTITNGAEGGAVAGVDVVFTPFLPEYGHYYQHVVSAANGGYSVQLANTDYNVLIQKAGFEDIFMRVWIDKDWPQMDFTIFPIGTSGGAWGGQVNGGGPMPGGDDGSVIDPVDQAMPPRPELPPI